MNQVIANPDVVAYRAMQTPAQKRVDEMQQAMAQMPQVNCPLDHEFTGKFYVRTIHVPAGTLVVSKIFKQDFPFFISKGKVSVWVEGTGVVHREAPFWGFTKAGSRRVIMHHTDVEWTTVHFVGELRDVDEIEEQVIFDPTKNHCIDIPDAAIEELKGATT